MTSASNRKHATGPLELRDRAPAFVQDVDQFRVERIRTNDVITVGRLPASSGDIFTEFAVALPVGFGGGSMFVFVTQILEQPSPDDFVDFDALDRLPHLFDSTQNFLQRLVGSLGTFVHELGKLAGQRGDHAAVRVVGDGTGQFLQEDQCVTTKRCRRRPARRRP